MADFDHKPDASGYRLSLEGGVTLVTQYPDGSVNIREKTPATKRRFDGTFRFTPSEWYSVKLHYDMYRQTEPFTIKTYDPAAPDPDFDEALVRYVGSPEPEYFGATMVRARLSFREI